MEIPLQLKLVPIVEALCVPIAFMSVRYVTINFVTNAIRGGGLVAVLKDAPIVTEPMHLLENSVNSWKIGTQNAIPILLKLIIFANLF